MDLLLQTLVQGLLVGGAYALVALGMGLTYNVSGIVNFAHGDYLTLAMFLAFMLQNGLLMTFGGQPLRTPSAFEASILVIGDMLFVRAPQLAAFAVSLALAAALYGVLNFTETGRRIRAVHQNPRAAALMGIDVPRVRTLTFAAGIGILALAGALLLPGTTIWPTQGLRFTVIALMALTLGGLTDFAGIYLGALVIGVAEAGRAPLF